MREPRTGSRARQRSTDPLDTEPPNPDSEAERSSGHTGANVAETAVRPRIGTTLSIGVGTLISLAPNLLPRTPSAQAILTALTVTAALAVAGTIRYALHRSGFDINERYGRYRSPLAFGTACLLASAATAAGHWQNELRAAMDVPPIGAGYWLRWAVGATLLIGGCLALTRGIARGLRRLGRARTLAIGAALALLIQLYAGPAFLDGRRAAYADANAAFDPAVAPPNAPDRAGSVESTVRWDSLGAQGRRFVAQTPPGPTVTYIGLDSAPDLNTRVALAVRELEASGGLARSNVVITVPTGSGWIDAAAAEGFTRRFGADVALVGVQYSYAPSWMTFVFGRERAISTARALFTAVERRIETLGHRPRLYVYGQSLGALGGSAIFADDTDQDRRTCAVLWAGPPAGEVHRGGATVLSNSSDPVVRWSPALLWRAPDLTGTRHDAPAPPWLPLVSFVQTTADLLSALDAPRGHGHRYGVDQGTDLGGCPDPPLPDM
ncbi:alpha/beta-hydrolase family protein [Nocardia bovistercoris]|uniref:Alpha/beta-hydrolase family protein n=1 Tax=Nocardia bovistercoris TaxID=2785916 RepID=A0A931N6V6_9NOCA|nr:alpha/beta-hydrolase family protein [Nocardia bovistercoris]MBH0781384.1 alpha/beta-hydrolase family protein [Nocardia bovistercoris]